ncbi:MAG TPA: 50S ribosomal protein L31 [Candidatus Deferrimicrobium sp.]|nr:50S ribosomal protein L31 [Candidatus Deferrimicrobium sp.]
MKENIHPKYFQTTIRCSCGETFVTGSTRKDLYVEVCSKCHPYYTGVQKIIDSAGRVEKFMKRMNKKVTEGHN